jgi:hypothetical protein
VPYLTFVLFEVPLALTLIQLLAILGKDMLLALASRQSARSPREPATAPNRAAPGPAAACARIPFLGPLQALAAMTASFLVHGGATASR